MHRRYALVGVLLLGAYALLPAGGARDNLYMAVGVSCLLAVLVGVRVNRPAHRAPWLVLAAGQACWVAGDWFFDPGTTATLSVSDVFYLAAYPLLALGIADLIRHRRARAELGGLIDSAIVTVAAGLLAWVFITDPIVDDTSRSVAARAVAVAYPAGDILLLALLIGLISVPGVVSTTFRLMTAALVMLLLADTVFASLPVAASNTTALDLVWLTSYVLWGLAALHPSMARISDAPHHRRTPFTTRRLVALLGAASVAPALMVAQVVHGTHVDMWVLVSGSSLLTLLVIGRMTLAVRELRSTTRQRDDLQSQLLYEASHDALTGLANGASMHQLIGGALRRGRRDGTAVAVLLLDLDAFDDVRTRHGHGFADIVLRTTADRVRAAAPDPEQVGRLGGELFAVCVDLADGDDATEALADRLMAAVSAPVTVGSTLVDVAVCIGAAISMDGGTDSDDLLQQAQVALRRAKATAAGTYEVFGDGLRREMQERRTTETALRHALDRGELELHYQPVVAVQTEIVDGYEARVQWSGGEPAGHIGEDFLAVAARSDLICDIDLWAVTTAAGHLASWSDQDGRRFADLTVAVPVSGRTLARPGFVDAVASIIREAAVEPHRLTIGVTEMALVDVPNALIHLTELRDRGVFVSVNEFGTGRTSIGGLGQLPADVIKIDSSLVNSEEPGAFDLLALLVNAAHGCGLLAVAEGVTDAGRLAELRDLQCDGAQGLHSPTADPADPDWTLSPVAARQPHLRVVRDPTEA